MKASTAKAIQIIAGIITVVAIVAIVVIVVNQSNLFGGGFFSFGADGGGGAFETSGHYEVQDEIRSFRVEWVGGLVRLLVDDGDTIRFEEGANKTIEERDALRYSVNGQTLHIEYQKPGFSLFNWGAPNKTLTIYWPRQALEVLSDVRIDTVSAPLEIPEFSAQNTLQLETVSGQLEAGSLQADELRFETVSGRISLQHGTAGRIKAGTVSGDIDLTVADVRNIEADTVSGQVRIGLDAIDAFDLDFESVSGRQQVGEGLVQRSDADLRIVVDTVSGGLQIEKMR